MRSNPTGEVNANTEMDIIITIIEILSIRKKNIYRNECFTIIQKTELGSFERMVIKVLR